MLMNIHSAHKREFVEMQLVLYKAHIIILSSGRCFYHISPISLPSHLTYFFSITSHHLVIPRAAAAATASPSLSLPPRHRRCRRRVMGTTASCRGRNGRHCGQRAAGAAAQTACLRRAEAPLCSPDSASQGAVETRCHRRILNRSKQKGRQGTCLSQS